jgi:hypothetical protein
MFNSKYVATCKSNFLPLKKNWAYRNPRPRGQLPLYPWLAQLASVQFLFSLTAILFIFFLLRSKYRKTNEHGIYPLILCIKKKKKNDVLSIISKKWDGKFLFNYRGKQTRFYFVEKECDFVTCTLHRTFSFFFLKIHVMSNSFIFKWLFNLEISTSAHQ